MQAAAKLFRRKGFAATSTRDIAAAARMQSGSPFYHFESKQDLLYTVMAQGMQEALDRLRTLDLRTEQHAPDALRTLVRTHLDTLLGPGRDFIPVMLYEWRSLEPGQRRRIARLQHAYEAIWVPVLEALAAQGRLLADVHLARLLVFGALNWTVQWFDPKKGASLDDVTDAALALFVRAAPPRRPAARRPR